MIRCLAIFALSCVAVVAQARIFSGVVTHVTDGDTLWVRIAQQGEPVKVRIQGMDAPESCQSGGAQASAALAARVLGQKVQLQSRSRDDYGRVVARVTLHGQDVGRWMVAQGHAWSYGWRGRRAPYASEQERAQAARAGLWAAAAVEPRLFRRQHGSCKH